MDEKQCNKLAIVSGPTPPTQTQPRGSQLRPLPEELPCQTSAFACRLYCIPDFALLRTQKGALPREVVAADSFEAPIDERATWRYPGN